MLLRLLWLQLITTGSEEEEEVVVVEVQCRRWCRLLRQLQQRSPALQALLLAIGHFHHQLLASGHRAQILLMLLPVLVVRPVQLG